MVTTKVPVHYWDSCTFIHAIQGADMSKAKVLEQIMDEVKRGQRKLVVSTFTVAEVVRPSRCSGQRLDASNRQKIGANFRHDNIILVDLSPPIAERAREIQWDIPGIRPVDAVHLATAEYAKVDYFDTFDKNSIIDPIKKAVNFSFLHPFIIGEPTISQAHISFPPQ